MLLPEAHHLTNNVIAKVHDVAFYDNAIAEQRGEDGLIAIDDIAETFWQLHHQGRTAWTFETELRPYKEAF